MPAMSPAQSDRPDRNAFAVVGAIVTVFLCGYLVGSLTSGTGRNAPKPSKSVDAKE